MASVGSKVGSLYDRTSFEDQKPKKTNEEYLASSFTGVILMAEISESDPSCS